MLKKEPTNRPLFPQWSHHVYPQFLPKSHPQSPNNSNSMQIVHHGSNNTITSSSSSSSTGKGHSNNNNNGNNNEINNGVVNYYPHPHHNTNVVKLTTQSTNTSNYLHMRNRSLNNGLINHVGNKIIKNTNGDNNNYHLTNTTGTIGNSLIKKKLVNLIVFAISLFYFLLFFCVLIVWKEFGRKNSKRQAHNGLNREKDLKNKGPKISPI